MFKKNIYRKRGRKKEKVKVMENLKHKFVFSIDSNFYSDNFYSLCKQSFTEKNHLRHSMKYILQFYLDIAKSLFHSVH